MLFRKKHQGMITVFLSYIVVVILVFTLIMVDLARIFVAGPNIRRAVHIAANDILTEYDSTLYNEMDLFAVYYDDTINPETGRTYLEDEVYKSLVYNLSSQGGVNLFKYNVESVKVRPLVDFDGVVTTTSERYGLNGGTYDAILEQIMEYQKYNLPITKLEEALGLMELGKQSSDASNLMEEKRKLDDKFVEYTAKSIALLDFIELRNDYFVDYEDIDESVYFDTLYGDYYKVYHGPLFHKYPDTNLYDLGLQLKELDGDITKTYDKVDNHYTSLAFQDNNNSVFSDNTYYIKDELKNASSVLESKVAGFVDDFRDSYILANLFLLEKSYQSLLSDLDKLADDYDDIVSRYDEDYVDYTKKSSDGSSSTRTTSVKNAEDYLDDLEDIVEFREDRDFEKFDSLYDELQTKSNYIFDERKLLSDVFEQVCDLHEEIVDYQQEFYKLQADIEDEYDDERDKDYDKPRERDYKYTVTIGSGENKTTEERFKASSYFSDLTAYNKKRARQNYQEDVLRAAKNLLSNHSDVLDDAFDAISKFRYEWDSKLDGLDVYVDLDFLEKSIYHKTDTSDVLDYIGKDDKAKSYIRYLDLKENAGLKTASEYALEIYDDVGDIGADLRSDLVELDNELTEIIQNNNQGDAAVLNADTLRELQGDIDRKIEVIDRMNDFVVYDSEGNEISMSLNEAMNYYKEAIEIFDSINTLYTSLDTLKDTKLRFDNEIDFDSPELARIIEKIAYDDELYLNYYRSSNGVTSSFSDSIDTLYSSARPIWLKKANGDDPLLQSIESFSNEPKGTMESSAMGFLGEMKDLAIGLAEVGITEFANAMEINPAKVPHPIFLEEKSGYYTGVFGPMPNYVYSEVLPDNYFSGLSDPDEKIVNMTFVEDDEPSDKAEKESYSEVGKWNDINEGEVSEGTGVKHTVERQMIEEQFKVTLDDKAIERLFLTEYIFEKFNYRLTSMHSDQISRTQNFGGIDRIRYFTNSEIEYILTGKADAVASTKAINTRIYWTRFGMNNLSFWLGNNKDMAVGFTNMTSKALAGLTGIAPTIWKGAIIGAWSAAESWVDVIRLNSGAEVEFFKQMNKKNVFDSPWYLGPSIVSRATEALNASFQAVKDEAKSQVEEIGLDSGFMDDFNYSVDEPEKMQMTYEDYTEITVTTEVEVSIEETDADGNTVYRPASDKEIKKMQDDYMNRDFKVDFTGKAKEEEDDNHVRIDSVKTTIEVEEGTEASVETYEEDDKKDKTMATKMLEKANMMSYEDYLKMMLLFQNNEKTVNRMKELIKLNYDFMNYQLSDKNYTDNLYTYFEVEAVVTVDNYILKDVRRSLSDSLDEPEETDKISTVDEIEETEDPPEEIVEEVPEEPEEDKGFFGNLISIGKKVVDKTIDIIDTGIEKAKDIGSKISELGGKFIGLFKKPDPNWEMVEQENEVEKTEQLTRYTIKVFKGF